MDTEAVVAGDFLYIDGGEFSYSGVQDSITRGYSSTLLSIDLRNDWVNNSVVINSISKPSNIPDLVVSGLWYQEASSTIYGGFAGRRSFLTNNDPQPNQYPLGIFSFKPDNTGLGTFGNVVGSSAWGSNTRPYQGAIAFSNETGYVLGGCATSDTSPGTADLQSPVALNGMLAFDMSSQKLSNISATGYNGNGTVEFARMEYLAPFGPQGLLFVLGGDQPPDIDGTSGEDDFVPFNTVSVYEPSSNKWYQQTTTGNIPEPRKEFCTAGVASTNETYEIFLYAGGSQIMTVGGLDTASDDVSGNVYYGVFNTSDPFANGLNIFDMSTLSFATKFTANPPPYTQSETIAAIYSSNPNTQYDDPALGALMKQKNFNPSTVGISAGSSSSSSSTNSSNSNPTSTPSLSNPTKSSKSSKSSTGAIVGGVIGGLAGLALLSATAFYLLRRRRSRQRGGAGGGPYAPADQSPTQNTTVTTAAMCQQERDAGVLAGPAGFYAPHGDDRKDGAPPMFETPPQELPTTSERHEMDGGGDSAVSEVSGEARKFELSAGSLTGGGKGGGMARRGTLGRGGGVFVSDGGSRKEEGVRSPEETHPADRKAGLGGEELGRGGVGSESEELYGTTSGTGSSAMTTSEEGTGTERSLADSLRSPESFRTGNRR
ncbi:MAG: hypothetical protein Q9165_006122 [Trypethelium subeluteriae]